MEKLPEELLIELMIFFMDKEEAILYSSIHRKSRRLFESRLFAVKALQRWFPQIVPVDPVVDWQILSIRDLNGAIRLDRPDLFGNLLNYRHTAETINCVKVVSSLAKANAVKIVDAVFGSTRSDFYSLESMIKGQDTFWIDATPELLDVVLKRCPEAVSTISSYLIVHGRIDLLKSSHVRGLLSDSLPSVERVSRDALRLDEQSHIRERVVDTLDWLESNDLAPHLVEQLTVFTDRPEKIGHRITLPFVILGLFVGSEKVRARLLELYRSPYWIDDRLVSSFGIDSSNPFTKGLTPKSIAPFFEASRQGRLPIYDLIAVITVYYFYSERTKREFVIELLALGLNRWSLCHETVKITVTRLFGNEVKTVYGCPIMKTFTY